MKQRSAAVSLYDVMEFSVESMEQKNYLLCWIKLLRAQDELH